MYRSVGLPNRQRIFHESHAEQRDEVIDDDEEEPLDNTTLNIMEQKALKFKGFQWSTTDEGLNKKFILELTQCLLKNHNFKCGENMYNQSSGITIGAYHAAPLVNLTLSYIEWTHIDKMVKDKHWKKAAEQANKLLHVYRYMDDRYSCTKANSLLPSYDMAVSSRQEGEIVDFIGWTIDLRQGIDVNYLDKREKLPTLVITRIPP